VKRSYDGGAPPSSATGEGSSDGGADDASATDSAIDDGGTAPEETNPTADQLPTEDPYAYEDPSLSDYADAAAPKKKKAAAKSGCSAAPGGPTPTSGAFLGLGLVLGAALLRRRRSPR
jgi:MYXO-CTERM domain-containing protein